MTAGCAGERAPLTRKWSASRLATLTMTARPTLRSARNADPQLVIRDRHRGGEFREAKRISLG